MKTLNQENLMTWQKLSDDCSELSRAFNEEMNKVIEAFREANKTRAEHILEMRKVLDEEQEGFKSQALEVFEETGVKKGLGGIGIRVTKKLGYDIGVALEWSKKNMPVIVSEVIDKKQFEKYAKETKLDFVTINEGRSATWPQKGIWFEGK